MRIDYSPPKQSYVGNTQGKPTSRKEPTGGMLTTLIASIALVTFIIGFSVGWFFAEKATKKGFQAAAEQKSLENAPEPPVVAPAPTEPSPEQIQPQQPDTPQTPDTPEEDSDPPLSFYKTLPEGQSTNFMGSGVNASNEKEKPVLQAAIPSNVVKRPQVAPPVPPKPPTEKPTAVKPPAEKPVAAKPPTEKPAPTPPARENNGFTVQVASYSQRSEAETMKNKLAGKGYNVNIVESNQGEKGTWYRVRIGRKLDHEAAKDLAAKIGQGAIVIPD